MGTIEEAAGFYKVSTRTIRRWVDKGLVRHIKIEKTVRVLIPQSGDNLGGSPHAARPVSRRRKADRRKPRKPARPKAR